MTEETLFAAALEKATPDERSTFLDDACSGDPALRQRVEALLQSHEQADFLKTPAVNRPAEELVGAATTGTEAHPTDGDDAKASLGFLAPSEKPDSLGRLGHYEILEVIGRGGMGIVLRAFDDKLHRIVAIKVLAGSVPTNGATRKRFTREARAAAAIRNEHVVGIFAVEEAGEVPYLVMEYIDGVSLQQRLDRGGPLEVKEILRIGLQIATGLAAAHAQGLIHRDIKPANILLENHVERVKITDFGLARARADASLTQEGVVAGTPQYMAPEQARGESLDHRADLFSLGSVLYALCTGRPPFRAENTLAVLKRVCEDTPRPIREINSDVPPWLVEIIAKLQAKDPAERFQSAQEVAEVLGRELAAVQRGNLERPAALPQPPGEGRGAGPPAKRSRRRHAVAAGVLLLFAAGLVLTESIGITNLAATVLRRFTADEPPLAKVDEGQNHDDPARSPVPAQPDPLKPFVVLAKAGRGEKSFATLAQAVAESKNDQDTIEIRGDGPFVSLPVELEEKNLTIRAGTGFRPVLRITEEANNNRPHLRTRGRLVLEGLDFYHLPSVGANNWSTAVQSEGAPLWMANCRFTLKRNSRPARAVTVFYSPILQLRNCHFIMEGGCCLGQWECPSGGQMTAEGNVILGPGNGLGWAESPLAVPGARTATVKDVVLRLRRNTLYVSDGLWFLMHHLPEPVGHDEKQPTQPYRIETSENLLESNRLLCMTQMQMQSKPPGKLVSMLEADGLIRQLVDWQDHRNVYGGNLSKPWQINTLEQLKGTGVVSADRLNIRLASWEDYWGLKDTGSLQGRIRFRSGVSPAEPGLPIERLLDPEDFRLAPDSAGKGAGEGGRDLGADVDLVGPGPAYERWKKTPAYQQWLKDSGQKK